MRALYIIFSLLLPLYALAITTVSLGSANLNACDQHAKQYLNDQLNDGLTAISMNNMSLSDACAAEIISYLVLLPEPAIHSLSFNNNHLGLQSIKALHEFVAAKPLNLQELDLSNNEFGHESISILMDILTTSKTINSLSFVRNHLGERKDKILSNFIKSWSALSSIDISSNNLTAEHMADIAGLLADSRTLNSLNLSYNPILDSGLVTLVSGLEKNSTIYSINLSTTKIGNKGAAKLLIYLSGLDRQMKIILQHNYFQGETYNKLKDQTSSYYKIML